jgi:hypothetical protein
MTSTDFLGNVRIYTDHDLTDPVSDPVLSPDPNPLLFFSCGIRLEANKHMTGY